MTDAPAKITLASAAVNDYLRFESVEQAYGWPSGAIAPPGDVRYFRITKKYSPTSVVAYCGADRILFEDQMLDDNNIHTVKAQFPAILYDWRLLVSLPAPADLPWRLRLTRWFFNLFNRQNDLRDDMGDPYGFRDDTKTHKYKL